MLTSSDIQGLLAKGERLSLECKLCASKLPNSLWDTYSAFANSYGGYILLGIEEHREEKESSKRYSIEGVTNPDKLISDFWNLANDSNKVSVNVLSDDDVQAIDIDGKKFHTLPKLEDNLQINFTELTFSGMKNDDEGGQKGGQKSGQKGGQSTTETTTEKTTKKTTEKVLDLLKSNPYLTNREMADMLTLSEDGVFYQIKKLKAKGIIVRIGGDKGGHWEIIYK